MENFSLGPAALAMAALGILTLLIGIIVALRYNYLEQSKNTVKLSSDLNVRNKYPEVDVFRHSGIFFKIGLAVALGLVTLAFSWTHYEKKVYVPLDAMSLDEIEIEIPRTTEPPQPPPPPPPPAVIETVPEDLLQTEQPDFVDISVDDDTPVEAPVQVKKEPTPTAPPPLPKKEEVEDAIFVAAEDMPRFPGCEELSTKKEKEACATKKLLEFIYKNIKYPAIARENGIEGTVVVSFVVEKDGSIAAAKVLRDIGGGCGQEAVRIINLMNNEQKTWRPGMQRGVPVRVQFNLPVKFQLQ